MTLIKSISGIRGTIGGSVGDGLTPVDIVKFSSAYGQWLIKNNHEKKVIIGRDARPSGEMVSQLVTATLQGMGIDVIDLDLSTTPTVEIAVPLENAGGGIILTASHNPVQWNALKLLNEKGEFISAKDGEEILNIAAEDSAEFADIKGLGKYKLDDTYLDKHIDQIVNLELVNVDAIKAKGFKIIVDGINSSGAFAIPKLLKALGVDQVKVLNEEVHGQFAHNPEPLPENLSNICNELEQGDYHLGIVIDPDVDRLAFISEDGSYFGEEYTLVAIADYILANHKGDTVSNLSSSRALRDITEKHGCKHHSAAVGEVNVVSKMKEVNAIIGGEGNGGVIYPELHYGRDALVGVALFLSHLAEFGKPMTRLRAQYPSYHISKNKIELTADINVDQILIEIKDRYKSHPINDIDGVKIDFDKEWVHLRKSNTEPIIRIYSESSSEATAEHLAQKIISDIREVVSSNA